MIATWALARHRPTAPHPSYLFLSAGPEAFRVLTGGYELEGLYRFSSLTIKGMERRFDSTIQREM